MTAIQIMRDVFSAAFYAVPIALLFVWFGRDAFCETPGGLAAGDGAAVHVGMADGAGIAYRRRRFVLAALLSAGGGGFRRDCSGRAVRDAQAGGGASCRR